MKPKISVIIDEELEKSLRLFQAELIKRSQKSVSFSDAVKQVLKTGMKQIKQNTYVKEVA
jgi:hypothetical protein